MSTTARRPTIRDVAHEAGVSVSTISKVMNDRDGIADETREHVRRVVERLGYVSRLGAQGMRAARTGVIGVLISDFEPYATEVLKGIARGSVTQPPVELMAWSGTVGDAPLADGWESRLLLRLGGSLIDGAILVTPSMTDDTHVDFPLVIVDPHRGGTRFPSVRVDDRDGARQAVAHLAGLGHRRIGHVTGRPDLESGREREIGFREAMAEHGLVVDPELVVAGDYTDEGATDPAHQLLTHQRRPTAIFAANDRSALRVMTMAHSLGLRIPEDLSVVGFDDIPDAGRAEPPLTTVAQPLAAIGCAAIELLSRMLRGESPHPRHVRLPAHLVTRGSTAPPRAWTSAEGDRG